MSTIYDSIEDEARADRDRYDLAGEREQPTASDIAAEERSELALQADKEERPKGYGLKFYEASHRYKLDGAWVPGVTTILGVLNKPALPKWAASTVAEYVADNREAVEHLYAMGRNSMVAALKETPWKKRDDAAARGTTFHDFAERILRGEEVDVPDEQVGLVESALAFMEDYAIVPIAIEGCVGSREHRYAGKFDLIADSKLGRSIFDWKSSKRIYATTAMQNVGYAFAEFVGENGDEKPVPEAERSFGVHIRADGYDVHELAFGPEIFAEWLTIRRAFDVNKRMEGDWRTPGSGYVAAAHQLSQHTTSGVSA